MHSDTSLVKARVNLSGSRLDLVNDSGIASVIDAGIGNYTFVFSCDFSSHEYVALTASDERGSAFERLDLERTKSELPIAIKNKGELVDAGLNLVIYE